MLLFLLQAFIISLTGVMAPGPVSAVTVGTGTKTPHAGAFIAIGHGIVEFPLIVLIYYGLGRFLSLDPVKGVIFTLGGLFLLLMGIDMLRSIRSVGTAQNSYSPTPVITGMLLSIGNAYFIIWWATVGASLLAKAVAFGIGGVVAFTVIHWLCDFVWLYLLSAVSFKGRTVLGPVFQQAVFAVSGVFLLFFSGVFLRDAVRLLAVMAGVR